MALDDLNLSDTSSGDLGGYFLVTITDLDLATQYPIQFQYVYSDKRQNDNWSAGRYFTTTGATVPNEPQLQTTDVVGGAGFIKVTWSGNDASGNAIENFDRVDVHISGTTFGDGTKPAGSFKSAGTQTFTCVPGIYIVQLKVYSLNGASSFFSLSRTVTVTEVGETIQNPVAPSSGGFSSRRILGGIEVSWDGTYPSSWTGFEAINIYAGTSSSATGGTYTKVGQMTANKVTNKIVVPVDGTYVRYNLPVYIHASSVNKNQLESSIVANVTSQSLGAGQATDTDINDGAVVISKLASNVLTVDNLKAGNINSTSYIRAGSGSTGGRIEISSATVGTVNPGLYIYNSAGTAVLSAPLGGGLTINGNGTFSGNLSAAGGTFTGTLSAASGSFSGTVTASGGSIGGITIAADGIQNSGGTFKLDSGGKARFGSSSGNAIIIDPSASVGGYYIYHTSNGGGAASGKFSVSTGGVLTATGGNFSGTITNGADYWNSNGTFQIGGSNGIVYNGSTISMGSIVSMPAAQITGTITADAIVANATISSPTITGGVFKTASSGQRIVINETANQIDIYPSSGINPGGIYGTTYSSAGALRIDAPYISGYSQPSMTLYSLGAGLAYIQVISNVTTFSGGATFGAGIDASATGTSYFNKVDIGNTVYANTLGTGTGLNIVQVQSGATAGYLKVSTSSRRFKENIVEINNSGYLDMIDSIKPVMFNYIEQPDTLPIAGLIAEDLAEIPLMENFVVKDSEGSPLGINYDRITVALIMALKEIKAKLTFIEKRLDALEA